MAGQGEARVVGVGTAVVDTIFAVDRLPLAPGKNFAGSVMQVGGGVAANAAVTSGERGVDWLEHGALRRQPAFAVEVVDTLAAGDVFHGALALALAERQPLERAVRFAAAAAAVTCARYGGHESIPDRAAVERLLREDG